MINTSASFAELLDTEPVHLQLTLPDGTQVGDGIKHVLGTENLDAIGFGDAALLITLPRTPVIKSAEWSGGSNAGDDITLGSAVAQQLNVEFDREALGGLNLADQMLVAELTIEGAEDVLQLAEVKVTNVDSTDDTVSITACDAMAWAFNDEYALNDAALGFNWETGVDGEKLLKAICSACGVPLGTTGLPPVTLSLVDAFGYTYREIIAFLACLWGRFARIDAQGRLVLQWYAAADRPIGPERYYDGELTKADYSYTVGYLKCYVEPLEETLVAGDPAKAQGIYIKCPWMTPKQLEAVWASIGGFTYRPVSNLRFLGDPRLEPGDVLQVTDRDGMVYTVPCMTLRHEFDGGLVSEITAVGKSESASDLDYMGPVTRAIERSAQEIKTSIIKFQDRIEATVEDLEGNQAQFNIQLGSITQRVQGLDGKYEEVQLTLDGWTITDPDGTTRIKGSSIDTGSIAANSITADKLNIKGSISFADLEQDVVEHITSGITQAQAKTLINSTLVSSPTIAGGTFSNLAQDVHMRMLYSGANKMGYLALYSDSYSKQNEYAAIGLMDDGRGPVFLINPFLNEPNPAYIRPYIEFHGNSHLMTPNVGYLAGRWDFSAATITGLKTTTLSLGMAESEPIAAISAAREAAAPRKVNLSDDGGRLKVETDGVVWYLDAAGLHQ